MIQEIIYTSAEKGLKQGSRGFCTVVATVGIPINLAERLESMSGYRQIFPVGNPRAALNPVAFSHTTTRIAGQSLHVVSRVADAGQDYTGRSNKLAHHLAFSAVDCIPAGPARLLTHPGIVVDHWNGEVRNVSPRQLPPVDTPETIQLTAWHAVSGDHGWAGSIAEQLLNSQSPVNVIFPLGTNTLLLTQEVLDLLPPEQRWTITFNTYFTRLLAGTECQLRFIADDTAEATAIRNDARARVVDLAKPLPPANGGHLVNVARAATIKTENVRAATPLVGSQETATRSATAAPGIQPVPIQSTLAPASHGKAILPPKTQAPRLPGFLPETPAAASRRGRFLAISATTILLIAATVIAVVATRPEAKDAYTALAVRSPDIANPQSDALRVRREALEKQKADREKAEKAAELAAAREAETAKREADARRAAELAEKQRAEQKLEEDARNRERTRLAALEKEGPFAFLRAAVAAGDAKWSDRRGQWLFELPKPQHNQSSEQLPLRLSGQLLEIGFLEAATTILPEDLLLPSIRKDETSPDTWQLTASVGGQSVPLGTYRLTRTTPANDTEPDAQLQFTWGVDASRESEAAEIARWLPLEVRVGNRKMALLQRKPESPQSTEHIPTWSSWCEGKPMAHVSTTALKAIRITEIKHINPSFYISDSGAPEQAIQLTAVPTEDRKETEDTSAPIAVRYFPLSRPFTLLLQPPAMETADTLPGFGKISFWAESDHSITPKICLMLKLPNRKTFIPDLPSKGLAAELQQLRRNPDIFRTIVGNQAQNGDWPELQGKQAIKLNDLRRYFKLFGSTHDWWHEQSLDSNTKLPTKTSFQSNLFTANTANDTVADLEKHKTILKSQLEKTTSVKQKLLTESAAVIPITNGVAVGTTNYQNNPSYYENRFADCEAKIRLLNNAITTWERIEPAIPTFKKLVWQLRDETVSGLLELTTDDHYDKCSAVAGKWRDASQRGEFGIRAVIESSPIATEDFENAESLVIVFYESLSPSKPATTTVPQANP